MHWKNLYRGFMMGICDIIPGVSGGTMALILGIYEQFIRAVSGFFSREWKRHLGFLLPLGAGMIAAIVALSNIINLLLEAFEQETFFLFTGLLIGILPLLIREGRFRQSFTIRHAFLIIGMAVFAYLVGAQAAADESSAAMQLGASNSWYFFISGWLASMAMLLPGVSGAFVLLLLGVYTTATDALSITNPDFAVIALVGSGVIVGFILSSKGIRWMFHRYPTYTYASIIGLILGAAVVIFPGFGSGSTAASLLCLAGGVSAAYYMSLKQP
ncbi:DUF368 domain-containing protein [Alkalicoccus urumqiensis]|uniref:DUF368 domain-containing protein n=1 Tax=Alkalicoccus urumqiensis TaxID=1548213 RepID=A0A2P6MFH2_ALKUR|nr:DUF368 domain-containing protein [Alkalicoccus urumqiensis]PRO65007.1 DUF368 domain-containing protein [Alkalicoccus urumqiensis]